MVKKRVGKIKGRPNVVLPNPIVQEITPDFPVHDQAESYTENREAGAIEISKQVSDNIGLRRL